LNSYALLPREALNKSSVAARRRNEKKLNLVSSLADGEGRNFPLPVNWLLQSQPLPQLHSLPSFIGQFLPLVLHLGWSVANAAAQISAVRTEDTILACLFIDHPHSPL
jgi:hypothetical protein